MLHALRAPQDTPLPIGQGQTISAPHMHAVALQLLADWLQPGARVLDVGSGSGYLTACMARMVQPGGFVLGVDKVRVVVVHSTRITHVARVGVVGRGSMHVRWAG